MKHNTKKHSLLLALPVLAALVFGTLGTSSAFADANIGLIPEHVSLEKTDAFLDVSTESPVDKAVVQFRGGTDGWVIIGGQSYDSKIGMTGKAVHQGNGIWNVKSIAEIIVENRYATLELKGKAVDGKLRLHGTGTLDGGEPFRIILRGNYTPIHDQPGDFVLDWYVVKIQNMDNGIRIPLVQDGVIHVKPLMSVEEIDDLDSELAIEE